MVETWALRIFWTCMLLCATVALGNIWLGPVVEPRFIPTFFILGFAALNIWWPLMAYNFLHKK